MRIPKWQTEQALAGDHAGRSLGRVRRLLRLTTDQAADLLGISVAELRKRESRNGEDSISSLCVLCHIASQP
jgi:transcriptional regulator with XRE-family HTH domain